MVKIRPSRFIEFAQKEEIGEIVELWKKEMDFFHGLDGQYFNPTALDKEEFAERLEITYNMFPIFILRISGKIKGFITINLADMGITDLNRIPYCEIEYLIVSRNAAMSGKEMLLKEVSNWARQQGYQRIDFKVYSKDKKSLEYINTINIEPSYHMMSVNVI